MSKERDLELFLVDILIAIEKIRNYTKEFSDVDRLVHEEVWDIITSKLELLDSDLKSIIKQNFDIKAAIASEVPKHHSVIDYFKKLNL